MNIIVEAVSPAYGGLTIGRWQNKIVMLKGAIAGETVEARIEEEKKDYCTASTTKVLEPSADRIEPVCRYYGSCGGCHLQHISYDKQISLKEEILQSCLKRIGKIDMPLSTPVTDKPPWHYRLRGQFKIFHEKAGFYREKTREIIDIDACPLMAHEINEYFVKAKSLLKDAGAREIHISFGDKAIALIKGAHAAKKQCEKLAGRFLDAGFEGIVVEDDKQRLLKYGSEYITLGIENLKYTVSPMSFFQSHWSLNQRVARILRDTLQPLGGKQVLDLYSGAGNFSLPLALEAEEVTAVEENPYAISDGRRNIQINNIKNYRFVRASSENAPLRGHFDMLIIDPPRAGITNSTMARILSMKPERVACISCNPSTLARDLKKLLAHYEIESLRMIDFFPQTYHIESLTFLRRR